MAERHPHLLESTDVALLVVDVQENFRSHIHGVEQMLASIALLVRGCHELGVPIAVSEQYPAGLGSTVAEVETALDGAQPWRLEKLEISTAQAPTWGDRPAAIADAGTILVCGIEAHVCISQTVHDLIAAGYEVHVAADAVGSRDPWQRELALERLARAGAVITSVEMALFEMLGVAGTERFKAVQRLIKQHDAMQRAMEVMT